MYGSLDISTSGLIAQRTRLNVISANLANKEAITNADGDYEPFRRRIVLLSPGDPASESGQGVHVREILLDESPLLKRYEPYSPFADADGYVGYPNIDPVIEQMNAMEAARSYEANITAAEATKSMLTTALRLLA